MTEPTDTPANPAWPPISRLESVKALIGDLARPYVQYAIGTATSAAIIIVAIKADNGNDGAIVIGAAGLIVGTIFAAKSLENSQASKHTASVEIAKAIPPAPPITTEPSS